MTPWPNGTADPAPVIRVHSGSVSATARRCPTHLRGRTERAFGAAAPGKRPYLARSAPGPLTAVLDLVGGDGAVPPGLPGQGPLPRSRSASRARPRCARRGRGIHEAEEVAGSGFRHGGSPARSEDTAAVEDTTARREHTVRSWLAGLHRTATPGRRGVSGSPAAPARAGAALLEHHLTVCPLEDASRTGAVRVDHPLTVDDPVFDVLVRSSADLVFRRGGSWVLRDLVTAGTATTVPDTDRLLRERPRAALLLLLGTAVVPAPDPPPVIELEALAPGGARVRTVDPASRRNRTVARTVVRALAAPWHADTAHLAAPGPVCRACPYRRWCPGAAVSATGPDGATGPERAR
ncbi:PD-(D/E)XK nuclease family protein [Nocardiopsis sp. FIRDI 009]|uniref:PD-(D/E)XK nuclease family protein n=1 Tax=Nocardiopsis sp. FIRDI 009 TaxID=714197 RepID=UPI000E22CC75|nr:hypothetical protein [Nocardiopsis sp. FIRDI 009]